MIIPPGQKKFKAQELRDFVEKCRNCQEGWIHVAFGFEEGKWYVYKFPCICKIETGWQWFQLDNPDIFRNREPDYRATPKELPGYVFIHPSHKRGFEKLIKRIAQIRHRQEQEKTEEVPF